MRLPIPIRGVLPATAVAGEAESSRGLASVSLEAALLSDPIREPATLPVLNQGCATVAAVRIVNGGIAVLRVASAGPAKGSVFKVKKVKQVVRCLFHALTIALVRDRDHGKEIEDRGNVGRICG